MNSRENSQCLRNNCLRILSCRSATPELTLNRNMLSILEANNSIFEGEPTEMRYFALYKRSNHTQLNFFKKASLNNYICTFV